MATASISQTIVQRVDTGHAAWSKRWRVLVATRNDPALTILRVVLGGVMLAHGAQKMLGWFGGPGFSRTIEFFSQSGIPTPLAILVICAEFFGGLGLIVGLLSRVAAAGIAAVMLGAVFMVHLPVGFFMNWAGNLQGEGYEYHLLAIAIALAVIIRGSGAWSLDRLWSG